MTRRTAAKTAEPVKATTPPEIQPMLTARYGVRLLDQAIVDPAPPYRAAHATTVRQASESGFTDHEIARLLGVSRDTVRLWEMIYPEFAAAIKAHNESRHERVERALYERAVGFEYEAVQPMKLSTDEIVLVRVPKKVLAEPAVALEWLTRHRPEIYGSKVADKVTEDAFEFTMAFGGPVGNQQVAVTATRRTTGREEAPMLVVGQGSGDDDAVDFSADAE